MPACASALLPLASNAAKEGLPIVHIPGGYRQRDLVASSHESGGFNELHGILGHVIAVMTYHERRLPFPDGTIPATLAWKREPSSELTGAFVAGQPTRVQVIVNDVHRCANTGGWGFGRFIGSRAVGCAQCETCFGCQQATLRDQDLLFTRFAP